MNLIKVGKIRNTHGIKGELKVSGDNPCFSKDYHETLYINTKPQVEVHIKNVRPQGDLLIVSFKEFNDINEVLKFKGFDILADKDSLGELDDNEYYVSDLIGLEVYNELDELKGVVKDVRKYPQGYYLEVQNGEKTSLIPFIDEFIKDVTDIIIVKEIEGLF